MGKRLTDDQMNRYDADGVVFPIDILSPEAAAVERGHLEAIEAKHGDVNYLMKPYLAITFVDELAHDERLLDAVEDMVGPNFLLWDGAFIIKEPHDDRFVSWHQDLKYWGIGPAGGVVSAWLALSPVGPENGCMRVIPGSHRDGLLAHGDTFADDNLLSRGQTIPSIDETQAIDVVLSPGQMSLHHGRVIHGSGPSRSDERRIGLNLVFVSPEVRQSFMDDDSAMLMRGVDECGNFAPEPRPTADFAPAALAFAKNIAGRRQDVLFRSADASDAKKSRYAGIS